ncbi:MULTISPECIES: hypothetical protein [unclassified Methylobacterium]|nr:MULTISPECIES: hypothetical protein [unclassified Methylobacterium]
MADSPRFDVDETAASSEDGPVPSVGLFWGVGPDLTGILDRAN